MLYENENKYFESLQNILSFNSLDGREERINKIYYEPEEFYDSMMNEKELKNKFINEIRGIIQTIQDMIYKPPYSILFGRIKIKKSIKKEKSNTTLEDCNKLFYQGFELDI